MNTKIAVEFPKGYFLEAEITEIKNAASEDYPLELIQTDKRVLAAFDDIISVVIIYFTHDFWTKVLEGLTVAAVIEGLKNLFGQFKKIMQSKKLYKTTADKVSKKQPTISIKGPNINIVLPVGVSDEKFNYCIDKSFESVKDAAPLIKKKETITFYDDSTGNVLTYTVEEYYWKKVVSPQGQEDDTRLFEED